VSSCDNPCYKIFAFISKTYRSLARYPSSVPIRNRTSDSQIRAVAQAVNKSA